MGLIPGQRTEIPHAMEQQAQAPQLEACVPQTEGPA